MGSKIKKTIVVQTAFAGDVVLCSSLAKGVKELYPESQVTFLVTPETSGLLKNNPFIDKVLEYDKRNSEKGIRSLYELIKKITDEQFDTAIVPHRSFRSAFIVKAAKIPVRIGFDKSAGSYFFNRIVKYSSSSHEVERNFSLLQNLGWDGKVYAPVLYPGEAERRKAEIFLGESGVSPRQQLLAVAPGSVWFTKRWPIEYFADTVQKLCKNFNIKTILIGGEKDRRLGDYIVSVSDGEAVNAMGKLSLLESAEVIRRCRVTLTNDSAPLHLSVAVGTPVVALFGPTTPDFGFYPWGSGHTVLYKNVDCSPCGIHGSRKCPKKHFKCMRTIMPEQVVEAVRKYL